MAQDPGFIFYPGDYLRDTQCLSEKSQVAYDRIMCEHMRNICISQQQLKFFTKRLNEDELSELMMVLTEKSDGFYISWVVESIEKRRAYSDSRRKNRSGSESKSNKKQNNISSTYVPHMDNENEIEYIDMFNNTNSIIVEKQKKLFDDILKFFKYDNIHALPQKELIFAFVYSLPFHGALDYAIEQITAYIALKTLDDKFIHKIDNFLGRQDEQFKKGKWNDNWVEQLKTYKKQNGKNKQTNELRQAPEPKRGRSFEGS